LSKQQNIPARVPLSLRPDNRLSEALVMTENPDLLAELRGIQNEFTFANRNMPVRYVERWDDPLLQKMNEVTFED